MEERSYHPQLPVPALVPDATFQSATEVIRSKRSIPPADYTLKIDSFSLLSQIFSKPDAQSYQSDSFEAGGYEWRLSLYPSGDSIRNGNGYISFYIILADPDNMPAGFEINVSFKLFVYDHFQDEYLTIQDINGRVRRFNKVKIEHGFTKFISLGTFKEPSNGYLLNDSCVFGAEIFVIRNTNKGDRLLLVQEPAHRFHTWKIHNFSKLDKKIFSHQFSAGGRKWQIGLYPRGNQSLDGEQNLSLYIFLTDCFVFPKYFMLSPSYILTLMGRYGLKVHPKERKIYAECKIRLLDQKRGQHMEREVCYWFSTFSIVCGYGNFVDLKTLENQESGFLVDDSLIVQVTFDVVLADTDSV
ncbi:hypothetical protein BDE02_08G181800 [Populus trichocarpa]|nr:hypothetical protein BDE02_08G181800 [Populus trichocarpa]